MKHYIYTSLVSLLIGAFVAFKLIKPTVKVVTQTKTEIKTNTITKYKRVKSSDGTVTTTIERDKRQDSTTVAKSVPMQQNWNAAVYVTNKQQYGFGLQYRIIGNLSVYGSLQTNGQGALGVGWSF